jgi:hypothetical protein
MQHLKPRDLTVSELIAQIESTTESVVEVSQKHKIDREAIGVLLRSGQWVLDTYYEECVFLRRRDEPGQASK